MDLSAKIKALRERIGLSMREFANKYLGEDYANYAKLEKSGTSISGRRVYRLSKIYGVKYENFLYKDADELTINLTSYVDISLKPIVKIPNAISPIELLEKCNSMNITIDDIFYTEVIEKTFKYKPKKFDTERIKKLRLDMGVEKLLKMPACYYSGSLSGEKTAQLNQGVAGFSQLIKIMCNDVFATVLTAVCTLVQVFLNAPWIMVGIMMLYLALTILISVFQIRSQNGIREKIVGYKNALDGQICHPL